ncbi:diadenylate cyclase [Candidatus Electrothrix aarhusensis]
MTNMSNTITHFMWGYQSHFRINQKVTCEILFQLLDEGFTPEVFLVGILTEERKDRFPACVDPEDDFWIHSSEFNSVLEMAEKNLERYPERRLRQSHPLAQERQDEDLWRRSTRDAIQQIIENNPAKPQDKVYFAAYPTKVEGYLVSVILGLQKSILDGYQPLTKNSVPLHECRSIPVPTSLIDAVVQSYLDKASGELQLPEPGCGSSGLNAEEILRDGANRLMMGLAFRVDQGCIEGWHSFLSSCTNIARTYYEGAEGAGTIVLARKDHPSLEKVIQFQTPSQLNQTKASRKLLQLASDDLALHTNSKHLFGLVETKQYDDQKEELFTVNFLGHHHWAVCHNAQILMEVRYGQPYLPKSPFDEHKLRKDLPRIFKKITQKHIDRIVTLVREAERERHGTMLVISSGAKDEADRLATEGTCISPKTLTANLLRNLTSIDGAVLLNPKGTCYALGVILDGIASKDGNSARGARYNSAIRYIHSSKHSALAVVVSEDGGVIFFPDLEPMIKRSEIDSTINELQKISENKAVNRRHYNEVMDWFDERRFYLLTEHCERINQLMTSIEEKIKAEDPLAIRIIRNNFVPNKNLDLDLYYENENNE